jgi:hydrogenase small subunit
MTSELVPPVGEIHILWISEGMSCDGDTVSMTAASQPSLEDIALGLIPRAAQSAPA